MSFQQVSEEQYWFVIGAHQAGASERKCSELSGISKTTTHNIISHFKKVGSPRSTKNSNCNKRKIEKQQQRFNDVPRKRGRPRKPFFTESIVQQALLEANRNQKLDKKSPIVYPLNRLDTPPTDDFQLQTESLKIGIRDDSQLEELPLTPTYNSPLNDMDEEQSDEKDIAWSMDEDQELLIHVLNLPLKHIKWKDVENKLKERHLAKICADRWEFLKKQLIKDIHFTVDKGASTSNEENSVL